MAIEINSENFYPYFLLGVLKKDILRYGEKHEAIKYFSEAINKSPENVECYFQRGLCYEESKLHMKDAIEDFTKVIKLKTTNMLAYAHRGNIYYLYEQYQKAIADFDKYLEIDPDNIEIQYNKKFAEILAK